MKKGCKTMALPITILKNVLNLNLMHIEKCEEAVTTYQAYGEFPMIIRWQTRAVFFKTGRSPKNGNLPGAAY